MWITVTINANTVESMKNFEEHFMTPIKRSLYSPFFPVINAPIMYSEHIPTPMEFKNVGTR